MIHTDTPTQTQPTSHLSEQVKIPWCFLWSFPGLLCVDDVPYDIPTITFCSVGFIKNKKKIKNRVQKVFSKGMNSTISDLTAFSRDCYPGTEPTGTKEYKL